MGSLILTSCMTQARECPSSPEFQPCGQSISSQLPQWRCVWWWLCNTILHTLAQLGKWCIIPFTTTGLTAYSGIHRGTPSEMNAACIYNATFVLWMCGEICLLPVKTWVTLEDAMLGRQSCGVQRTAGTASYHFNSVSQSCFWAGGSVAKCGNSQSGRNQFKTSWGGLY